MKGRKEALCRTGGDGGRRKGPSDCSRGSGLVIQTPWMKLLQLRIRKGLTDFFTHLWIKISS